jgi:hypothetical protein
MEQDKYVDTAVRAVTNKRPVPEIDFTLHTMEDGTQVSTLERVCKGMYSVSSCRSIPPGSSVKLFNLSTDQADPPFDRRASARLPPADRRAILLPFRPQQAQPSVPQATLLPRGSSYRGPGAMDLERVHKSSRERAQPSGDGCPHYRLR